MEAQDARRHGVEVQQQLAEREEALALEAAARDALATLHGDHARLQMELHAARIEHHQTALELAEVRAHVSGMERSVFWRARNAWALLRGRHR